MPSSGTSGKIVCLDVGHHGSMKSLICEVVRRCDIFVSQNM